MKIHFYDTTIHHELPNVTDYDACRIDSDFRRHIHIKYPGACFLEYQQVIEIFIDCLLQCEPLKKKAKQQGTLGKVIAFAPAHGG